MGQQSSFVLICVRCLMCIRSRNKLLLGESTSALGMGHAGVRTEGDHLPVSDGLSVTTDCQRNKPGNTGSLEVDNRPSRKPRSRSLPTNQLDTWESEGDPSNDCLPENIQQKPSERRAEICQTQRRYRKKVKLVEYRQPRYLSNRSTSREEETDSDTDPESTSLLTAPEWTVAYRRTTSVQIETQL